MQDKGDASLSLQSLVVTLRTDWFNSLKAKNRLFYLKTQSVSRCKHFSSRL